MSRASAMFSTCANRPTMAANAPEQPRKNAAFALPDYAAELVQCSAFLERFRDAADEATAEPKYMRLLQEIANRDLETLQIDLDNVAQVCKLRVLFLA